MEASQHDIQLEDGDLDELDDNFSDLSDDDGNEDGIGLEPQVRADRGKKVSSRLVNSEVPSLCVAW